VTEFKVERCSPNTMPVQNLSQYRTGTYRPCGLECRGHYAELPNGAILPPEGYAVFGDEPNPLGRAILNVCESGNLEQYESDVKAILNGKEGLFRAGVFGSVSGSLRMPMIPAPDYPRGSIVVPIHIARNLVISHRGKEVRLIDCKWGLYNRPPTIYPGSIRPVRLYFWDRDALGLPVDQTTESHADFDGDEGHLYPLLDPLSEEEVERWCLPNEKPGLDAQAKAAGGTGIDWMVPTTHAIHTARTGFSDLCSLAGCKEALEQDFVTRLRGKYNQRDYSDSAKKGCMQITNQQLEQATVGFKFRVARIGLSEPRCDGALVHSPRFSFQSAMDACLPGYLAACAICAKLQQRALDSHRAVQTQSPEGVSIPALIVDGGGQDFAVTVLNTPPPKGWIVLQATTMGNHVVCITAGHLHPCNGVVGSTSPYLVRAARNPHGVYLRGLAAASQLGSVELTEGMLRTVACCVVPAVISGCLYPLSVEGAKGSKCHWLTKVATQWWTYLIYCPQRQEWSHVNTLRACAMFASYSAMPSVGMQCL